eukprot:4110201-Pyramimonas_sp.AAC.3
MSTITLKHVFPHAAGEMQLRETDAARAVRHERICSLPSRNWPPLRWYMLPPFLRLAPHTKTVCFDRPLPRLAPTFVVVRVYAPFPLVIGPSHEAGQSQEVRRVRAHRVRRPLRQPVHAKPSGWP